MGNAARIIIIGGGSDALPRRVVCLKAAPRETDPEILASRKELEEHQDVWVFHFEKVDTLNAQRMEVCSGWVRSILAAAEAG